MKIKNLSFKENKIIIVQKRKEIIIIKMFKQIVAKKEIKMEFKINFKET